MIVHLKGNSISLTDTDFLDMGGEAKVYKYKRSLIKVYHSNMIDSDKIEKLKHYPKDLPSQVMSPKELVYSKKQVIGFLMDRIYNSEVIAMLSNKKYRIKNRISQKQVTDIFKLFLKILKEIHNKDVVIGDLSDLNILFNKQGIYFIDADSFQFNKYPCIVGTELFADPKLLGIDFSKEHKYTRLTDYFSYCVMLFRSLLYISPYGGVLKGYNNYYKRAEARKSIFSKKVKISKVALPYKILPDDMLDYFSGVFEKDKRDEFPEKYLNISWKKCKHCGLPYAGTRCPCDKAPKGLVVQTVTIHKKCKATIEFSTDGIILLAKLYNNTMLYIYEDNNIIRNNYGEIIDKNKDADCMDKDKYINQSEMFSYDISEYSLMRVANRGLELETVGSVVRNRTKIFVGKDFGFGFYRLSDQTTKYFLFYDEKLGLEYIDLPAIKGKLIDVECTFSLSHMIFMYSIIQKGKKTNYLYLLKRDGSVEASLNSQNCSSELLKYLHGKTMSGNKIITPTDKGLLLSIIKSNDDLDEKEFPDTEPFVDSYSELFTCNKGIYVVSDNKITLLELQ